ncbi:MAG: hypothetical protein ACOYL8_01905 [Patescibacteria group bacterium]
MKRLFFLALIVAFFVPSKILAQATVTNETNAVLVLKSTTGSGELVVQPNSKNRGSFISSSGAFNFDLYACEGAKEMYVATFKKNVSAGRFSITNKDLTGDITPAPEFGKEKIVTPPIQETGQLFVSERQVVYTTKLVLKNSSSYRVTALDGVLNGLALAPNQASVDSFSLPTGQFEVTFKHDVNAETELGLGGSTNKARDKVSLGKSYRQSVFSTIIVQGQKELVIKDDYLNFTECFFVTTFAKSNIPFKIVFTAGLWKGQALNQGEYTRRAKLSEGFNSLAIQYVGSDGLKYQADIEVIVTARDKPLILREIDIKNKKMIKQ